MIASINGKRKHHRVNLLPNGRICCQEMAANNTNKQKKHQSLHRVGVKIGVK